MNERSFIFNNRRLSDLGMMLCYFDSVDNIETVDSPTITFNIVQNNSNDSFRPTSASYDGSLESNEIGICKVNCNEKNLYFTRDEVRAIYKWLDTKSFRKFVIENDPMFEDVYFLGGFTQINQVRHFGKVIGFKLKFTSQYPYGLSEDIKYTKTITSDNKYFSIINDSDDVKPVYPSCLKITMMEDGDLTIKNTLDEYTFGIRNCKNGEVITVDCVNKIIETDKSEHDIYNDFNYNYFRLLRNDDTDNNKFTVSLMCKIEFTINEPRKVGFI